MKKEFLIEFENVDEKKLEKEFFKKCEKDIEDFSYMKNTKRDIFSSPELNSFLISLGASGVILFIDKLLEYFKDKDIRAKINDGDNVLTITGKELTQKSKETVIFFLQGNKKNGKKTKK